MAESIKRSLIPVMLTAGCGLLAALLTLSARAGSLETRVSALESDRVSIQLKLDHLIEVQQQTREMVIRLQVQK